MALQPLALGWHRGTMRHGGKRKGAGRKPTGRRPYLVRVKPNTMRVIRKTAKAAGFKTPGELLDADYAP